MGRYTGSVCRLCRRERIKLFLKGSKCETDKCPIERRPYPPGEHGKDRRAKESDYGVQLREKQKAKRIYGSRERQFRNYFTAAVRQTGVTGEKLLERLELRLDNVVYRLGLAPSRAAARQLIRHRHIEVEAGAGEGGHGVLAVGHRLDLEALVLEEEDVRPEEIDLVVGPENVAGFRHWRSGDGCR